ncbi:MAG: hypothetical protein ABJH45_16365 [Paracoccaceae bacterium]
MLRQSILFLRTFIATILVGACSTLPVFSQTLPKTLAEVINEIGDVPEDLSGFVLNNIAIEPYSGILRTPEQTLSTSHGSLAERAALLAALLQEINIDANIFQGAPTDENLAATLSRMSWEQAINPNDVPSEVQELLAEATGVLITLGDALHANGINIDGPASLPAKIQKVLATPLWVQTSESDGQEVFGFDAKPDQLALAQSIDNLHYRLSLVVSLESKNKNGLFEEDVLELTLPLVEIDDGFIGLHMDVADNVFQVALSYSGKRIVSRPIALTQSPKDVNPTVGALGGLGGALGNLTKQPNSNTRLSNEDSELTSLILRYKLTAPDDEMKGKVEVWRISEKDSDGTLLRSALSSAMAVVLDTGVPRALESFLPPGNQEITKTSEITRLIALPAVLMQSYRDTLPSSIAGSPLLRARTGPGLVIARIGPTQNNSIRLELTLEETGHLLIPPIDTKLQAADLFYERVFAGILDATVERATLSSEHWDTGAVSLFEAIAFHKGSIRVLQSPDQVTGPEPLRSALFDGQIVILPEALPANWQGYPLSWWEIVPSTGQTRDTNSFGRHQAFFEHRSQNQRALNDGQKMRQFTCAISLAIGSIASQYADVVLVSDPAAGLVLQTFAQALEGLGQGGCKNMLGTPETAWRAASAGVRSAGKGFRPIRRILNRKPWRPNGPTFPGR